MSGYTSTAPRERPTHLMAIAPSRASEADRSRAVGAGLCAVSAAGFATLSVFGKIGLASGMTLAGMLSLRFAGAAVVLGLGLVLARKIPSGLNLRTTATLLAMGMFGYGVQSTFYFLGLSRLPASVSALLLYVYPLFVALYDRVLNHRPLHGIEQLSLALALVGVPLTVRPSAGEGLQLDPIGLGFVLASAAWYAGYIIASDRVVRKVGAWASTAWISFGAAIAFTLGGLATRSLDWRLEGQQVWLLLGLIVFSTILPLTTFLAGVARLGPTLASIVSTLEPVFTAALAALVLRESLAPLQVVGGMLILSAALLVHWPRKTSGQG
ncbi:MAG TPA: DMT family transporter [Anaerolineales bacterium]|nr:DMT family transporter [Anaerolineales bacterium]